MEDELRRESQVSNATRKSFKMSNSLVSRLKPKREKKKVYKWTILTDPRNKFTDDANPFFIHRERTTLAYIAPQYVVDGFRKLLKHTMCMFPLALIMELIGPYGLTEFLPDEVTFITLLGAIIRMLFFFRLNTDILEILFRQYEFWVLMICCLLGTIGLMHAFRYDKRCALAFEFLSLGTYAACEDAANKYSKKGFIERGYVVGTFLLYVNLTILVMLIYFGYVPNLENVEIFFPTFPSSSNAGNQTAQVVSGFTVGTLNITLGLVQAILIYLFKQPYHLNRNELAILQVKLFAKSVDIQRHKSEQEERKQTVENLRRVLSRVSRSESEHEAEAEEELSYTSAGQNGSQFGKVHQFLGIDMNKKMYRIAPVQNEFVVRGQPFNWDKTDTVGNRLVGEKWSGFCYKTLYYNRVVKGSVLLYSLVFSPILLFILFGWIPKQVALISIPGYIYLLLYCNTLNYEILKRVLQTAGVRVMIGLMLAGNLGLAFAFNFDERTSSVLFLSLSFLAFVAFSDARIRSRSVSTYAFVFFTYVYVSFTALLVCFYLNLIVDIDDTEVDLASLVGKNSTLQLSTVGYSLYCLEIVVLFLARNYYSITFKNGFSALENRLRYFVQDLGEALETPAFGPERTSEVIAPTKELKRLIQNTLQKRESAPP